MCIRDRQVIVALTALSLLLFEGSLHGDANDETFGPVVEIVEVNHGYLVGVDSHPMTFGVGQIAPYEPFQMTNRRVQAAHKSIDRASANRSPGPHRSVV